MVDTLSRLVVVEVTAYAVRTQPREDSGGCRAMTSLAFDRRVGPHQGKPVLMLLKRLPRGLPASHRMAVVAARPKLLPVYIGMAVGAVRGDVVEDQLAMAAAASHPLVHAP